MEKIFLNGPIRNQLQSAIRESAWRGWRELWYISGYWLLVQELNLKYQLGLPFPNFDVVFMNSIAIRIVIKIAEWMKQWCESILLPYSSYSNTKTNIKALYEFSVCFSSSSKKDQFILPLCVCVGRFLWGILWMLHH
jgi:hypothetical protein